MMKLFLAALAAVVVAGCATIQVPEGANKIAFDTCFYQAPDTATRTKRISESAFVKGLSGDLRTKVETYEKVFRDSLAGALSADGFQLISRRLAPEQECQQPTDEEKTVRMGVFFVRILKNSSIIAFIPVKRPGEVGQDVILTTALSSEQDVMSAAKADAQRVAKVIAAASRARVIVGSK